MYQYQSNAPKRREMTFAVAAFALGAAFFALSKLPNAVLPSLLQLFGMAHFTVFLWLLVSCFLQTYTYCITPREGAYDNDAPDFVILQRKGTRSQVVCRISVQDVVAMERITPENRRAIAQKCRGAQVYRYVDRIYPENLYLLTVRDGDLEYYLRILTDERLRQTD